MIEDEQCDDVAVRGEVVLDIEPLFQRFDIERPIGHHGVGAIAIGQHRVAEMHHRTVPAVDVPAGPPFRERAAVIRCVVAKPRDSRAGWRGGDAPDQHAGHFERGRRVVARQAEITSLDDRFLLPALIERVEDRSLLRILRREFEVRRIVDVANGDSVVEEDCARVPRRNP